MKTRFAACLILVLALGACVYAPLKKRASFEMSCPESSLEITDLGGSAAGVTGCGKRGVYLYTQEGWVRNSNIESAGSSGSAGGDGASTPK